MEEDDTNPNLEHPQDEGVEEVLPPSFFHAPRSFHEDVSDAALDQPILARDSRKSAVPGSSTRPGAGDNDERHS